MPSETIDFSAILEALAQAKVDFIVVGGVCAALHGAPVSTFDLDLIYSRERSNLDRLEQALTQLQASYRMKPEIKPSAARLDTAGHHQTMTRFGPLDLLGSTVGGQGYPELSKLTQTVNLEMGMTVSILDLPTLIRIKETLARDRDLAVLPILRKILEEK